MRLKSLKGHKDRAEFIGQDVWIWKKDRVIKCVLVGTTALMVRIKYPDGNVKLYNPENTYLDEPSAEIRFTRESLRLINGSDVDWVLMLKNLELMKDKFPSLFI